MTSLTEEHSDLETTTFLKLACLFFFKIWSEMKAFRFGNPRKLTKALVRELQIDEAMI